VNVDGVDPKTFIVDDLEVVTWKRAGELRQIVRVRDIVTGTARSGEPLPNAMWRKIRRWLLELRVGTGSPKPAPRAGRRPEPLCTRGARSTFAPDRLGAFVTRACFASFRRKPGHRRREYTTEG
jgi:hypothetical protein